MGGLVSGGLSCSMAEGVARIPGDETAFCVTIELGWSTVIKCHIARRRVVAFEADVVTTEFIDRQIGEVTLFAMKTMDWCAN